MNSMRNGLGMRETEIAKEPSRPWNPHFYAIFAQVHNTLYRFPPSHGRVRSKGTIHSTDDDRRTRCIVMDCRWTA
jgi:hypothetical protein